MSSTRSTDAGHAAFQRVLVTGGCGFIGSALVRYLVGELGVDVLNLDKLTYAGDPSTVAEVAGDPRYQFARVDICDGPALWKALAEFRPEAVVHLAAESHVDRSIDSPGEFIRTNIVGTCMLLEAALRYWQALGPDARQRFRVLHVSTDEVYGTLPLDSQARFSESTPFAPSSPYAASKASADHLARAWNRTYGLPLVTSRCCNNYGPYQAPEKLVPRTIIAALEGRSLEVYGNGLNVRDWIYVDDHVRALVALLEAGVSGGSYLIGAGAERRNIDLVRTLCVMLDEFLPRPFPHESLIQFVPDRPGHDLRYAVDDSRLRTETGWQPRETLETGLRRTVSWYVEHRAWWQRLRGERGYGDRLGLATGRLGA